MNNQDTFPSFKMYAVLNNDIVIDAAIKNGENMISAINNNIVYDDKYEFIEMTLSNTPAFIKAKYDRINNKFIGAD